MYQKGDILKRNEVGDYGEMWLEITSVVDDEFAYRGVLRNKDWEVVDRAYFVGQTLTNLFTPAPDEIKVGDLLENEIGDKRKVLARTGNLYGVSLMSDDSLSDWYIKEELDDIGYKLLSTTPRTLTQEEARKILEEKLGEKIIIKE